MHEFSLITFDRFHQRFLGLMGRRDVPATQVFHFIPCQGIHTCAMRFAVSVLFLDRQRRLLRFIDRLAPYRMVWYPRAHSALELRAGVIHSDAQARRLITLLLPDDYSQ